MKHFVLRAFTASIAFIFAAGVALTVERRANVLTLPPMPEARESGLAPVNGIQMYYAIYGDGDPILLIHGGLSNASYWAHQVIELSKSFKVIVADSRGHGRSTRNGKTMGYDLMAEDYVALLDYLDIEKTALVGWSDGGIIGIDIAMHHPERLTRLFAHAANVTVDGLKPDPPVSPEPAVLEADPSEVDPKADATRQRAEFVAEINRMWTSEPNWTSDDLAQIHVPTAIVIGDHDEAIRFDHAEYMARAIPGARLVVLRNVGHIALLQDPAAYNRAIIDFMKAPLPGEDL